MGSITSKIDAYMTLEGMAFDQLLESNAVIIIAELKGCYN